MTSASLGPAMSSDRGDDIYGYGDLADTTEDEEEDEEAGIMS